MEEVVEELVLEELGMISKRNQPFDMQILDRYLTTKS